MADEITIAGSLKALKNFLSIDTGSKSVRIDMAGDQYIRNVQTVGTTYEAILTGDLATSGLAYFQNLDATNYVEIGREVSAAFYPVVQLYPGEFCVLRLSTLLIFAKANAAPVPLDVLILEA